MRLWLLAAGPGAAALLLRCGPLRGEPDAIPLADASPVVQMDGQKVSACGVRLSVPSHKGDLVAELGLKDDGAGRRFHLTAFAPAHAELADVHLKIGVGDSALLLGPLERLSDGRLHAARSLPGLTGTELMQSLMVSGGTLSFTLVGDAPPVTAELRAPFPHSVRQLYLSCAGDLPK